MPMLSERRVSDNTKLVDKLVEFAVAVTQDHDVWRIFNKHSAEEGYNFFSSEEHEKIKALGDKIFMETGKGRPVDFMHAVTALRYLILGKLGPPDSDEFRQFLVRRCRFW